MDSFEDGVTDLEASTDEEEDYEPVRSRLRSKDIWIRCREIVEKQQTLEKEAATIRSKQVSIKTAILADQFQKLPQVR